jgi:putative heme-binding domain-containing protein
VRKLALDEGFPPAVSVLATVAGQAAVPELVKLSREGPSEARTAAIEALCGLDLRAAAEAAAALLASGGAAETDRVLSPFLLHADGPRLLTESLSAAPPPKETAVALLGALATAGRNEPALAAALRRSAELPENASVIPDYSAEFVARIIADAKSRGDAENGKAVFLAAQSACIGCHKVGDSGGITGPDLTSIGRGMTPELITESVLWPKRQIKEGFFLTTVATHDGKLFSGYKISEDAKSLTLRPPGAGAAEPVLKSQIKERGDTGTLMPDGLTAWMTEQQQLDLLRYLFDLGK